MNQSAEFGFHAIVALVCCLVATSSEASPAKVKEDALKEWRALTSAEAEEPLAFVKGDEIRLYFKTGSKDAAFAAHWSEGRLPTDGYKLATAQLRPLHSSSLPNLNKGWKQATVLWGDEGREVAQALADRLTPTARGHGVCFESLFADQVLFRDEGGAARWVQQKEKPEEVEIDRHYFVEDSLGTIAEHLDSILTASHPEGTLFLVISCDSSRYAQPVLFDRARGMCVGLWLANLYDSGQSGTGIRTTADAFSALVLESHGIALIKNPVSSAVKLVDAGIQLGIRVIRLPGLNFSRQFIPAGTTGGMDLAKWEDWLDRHTGTRLEEGSLEILIDGDQFYERLAKAIQGATNHISVFVYLFDRDDTAVEVADLLKQRSHEVRVKVSYDRMCSLVGAELPKETPLPEDFTRPDSVARYLRQGSEAQVRCFLNPWFTMNHSKLFLVDGHQAWIGGMNFGRQYAHEWHDMMIQVEGPVVRSLEAQFQRTWAHSGPWGDLAYAAAVLTPLEKPTPEATQRPWSKVRRLPTSKGLKKPYMKAVLTALEQSRSYIYIENGYLFDHGIVKSLGRARKRGVDVRVIFPRGNNFSMGQRSNMVSAEALRRDGVRVYFWPGMTHTKALLVDGWACIGSANLNQWNLRLSQEENMATSDPDFIARLKAEIFEEDFARSYELNEPIEITPLDRIHDSIASF